MRKLLSLCGFLLSALSIFAQQNVSFDGSPLDDFIGQQVCFQQTLVVCGHQYKQSGDTLYLSYQRLRQPEEVAIQGTPAYDSAVVKCNEGILSVVCPGAHFTYQRTGATITNLVGTVIGTRQVRITTPPTFQGNPRPTGRPDLGDASIIVCTANLEYYCPEWSYNTLGAQDSSEFALQHLKTIKGLLAIDADIYALAELQQGSSSLQSLVDGLNASTSPGRYAYVNDFDTVTCKYIKVGFLYRTDRVRPSLMLAHPYSLASSSYVNQVGSYRRQEVQAFEELSSGERFVVSMNHFKSKSGGDSTNNYYNAERVENAAYLVNFLNRELENGYYADSDILILGDLNCSTMEEPIRYLQNAGFENQLTRFCPDEYSYVYNRQVQYLDYVLASPTMADQITGVMPCHINADESYLLHYNYVEDTTMYRYSDHDPIVIGLNLHSEPIEGCSDIHYFESMDSTFGTILPVNELGTSSWFGYSNYQCAYMNGSSSGANRDWLVLPTFDLSGLDSARISFTHTFGYGSSDTWAQHGKLLVSKDYDGDIAAATWAQLPIQEMPSYSWQWRDNSIVLPQSYQGHPAVTLAFKYEVVSTSSIPAWEVKNISFDAFCVEEDTTGGGSEEGVADIEVDKEFFSISFSDGGVIVVCREPSDMFLYDMMGREVARAPRATRLSAKVPAGIYVVCCGSHRKKVFVR